MKKSAVKVQPSVHPSAELMADFAAGQLHPYRRWMVEAHLELCTTCRGLASRGSRLGGAWYDSLGPETTPGPSGISAPDLWSRLEAELLAEWNSSGMNKG